ncbi:hypothetical protein PHSY_004551 [Pseudozyma hubeiensis SY62]|uniref:Uncharacterized protein n=1 Tax=Pseudozyma hubeiensis (strain SY62) TaxID=1305764 RepID=R9P6U9_PSEHS|nr:hypothetical protein PHSY_004551 [Pseudozyma hubeiensis SY62]GAC96967.1 hypothetical protein PHSY_004551 [Pseudozyma hubeiensis SY62]
MTTKRDLVRIEADMEQGTKKESRRCTKSGTRGDLANYWRGSGGGSIERTRADLDMRRQELILATVRTRCELSEVTPRRCSRRCSASATL